nr:hypothetical protein [Xanthomonas euvesicatoria]
MAITTVAAEVVHHAGHILSNGDAKLRVDAFANLIDGAGDVHAGNERRPCTREPSREGAVAHHHIDRVDAGGAHFHAHLARRRMRVGELHQPQDFGAAVIVQADCEHVVAFL